MIKVLKLSTPNQKEVDTALSGNAQLRNNGG